MLNDRAIMSSVFELDDDKLIEQFTQGSDRLLVSANLRLEINGGVSQLFTRNGEAIAIMYLQNKPCSVIIKHSSPFSQSIDGLLIDRDFVKLGNAVRPGFIEYKHFTTPAGYRIWHTEPAVLWKKWWPTERFQDKQRFNMDILVNFKHNWYPVQNIIVNAGIFTIKTIAGQLELNREDRVLWLAQNVSDSSNTTGNLSHPISTTAAEQPPVTSGLNSPSPANLAKKIHQKQLEIQPDRAWSIIKKLEQQLHEQVQATTAAEDKANQLESRAVIAEQRLQIIYKYLQEIGVNPRDIYSGNKSTAN